MPKNRDTVVDEKQERRRKNGKHGELHLKIRYKVKISKNKKRDKKNG